MRRSRTVAVCVGLFSAMTLVIPSNAGAVGSAQQAGLAQAAEQAKNPLEVYVGEIDQAQLNLFRALGLDHEDVSTSPVSEGKLKVEAVLTKLEANRLASKGVKLTVKTVKGKSASDALRAQAVAGNTVFRSYSEPGGLREELEAAAAAHPNIAKIETIGHTVQGKPIKAVKVTRFARLLPDGVRPSVIYIGAQHAREWITPEMIRRLMHRFLDGYGTDPEITQLVNTTELWFIPVANPDGYDFTFTEGNRLWRKNLHDNNGDGQITPGDGVDPNRNYATKWGWDNEGSSADPSSETFRGTGPNSEPESKALDALFKRVKFEFFVNYHSAAELLLYGLGWQVSTPTPDDVIYEALAGTDTNSAIPGYDPDISAELYTTNGDTDSHMQVKYGTLGFTPEMTTCQTASAINPDDQWLPEDCASGFNFPDDETLIQAEFAKNIPFALSLAKSAANPDRPVSAVGLTAPDFVIDSFDVSYGKTQPVAAIARKSLKGLRANWKVNGGYPRSTPAKEWKGGERYGDTNNDYYGEFRGNVTGTKPGDLVEVWFTGYSVQHGHFGPVASSHFTYKVHSDIGGRVLVLAAEDVTGRSPGSDQGVTSAKYADETSAALQAAGYSSDVYDFDVMGRKAPHHLGVLSHYDAVVWETGDDIIPRDQGQPGGTATKATLDTELAVRDYLNEGGKLLLTGKYAGYAQANDGAYSYNPFAPPQCTTPGVYPCLPLFNDFQQYYLGAYTYVDGGGTLAPGTNFDLGSTTPGRFNGFTGVLNAPGSAANQDHTASFLTTSSFLPPAQFPQFKSSATVDWLRPGGSPFDPHTGAWYLYSNRSDTSFKRLSRTVDLTSASAGELKFWSSYDTEPDWDYLFVEAHVVGTDNWTTLPEVGGHTTTDTGQSCASGWVPQLHPFLAHYQGADCSATGTTGTWNALTGKSGGWTELAFDLAPYAGKQVELSITYASDWGTQGLGVFLDDVTVNVGGTPISTSFEAGLDGWTVAGPPPGESTNSNDWSRSQLAFEEGSVVVTRDSVFTGFGIEGLAPAARDDFVKRAMKHLLGH